MNPFLDDDLGIIIKRVGGKISIGVTVYPPPSCR